MVVYFSATGNCEYAAEKIAEATADTAVSMTELCGEIELSGQEYLGIVVPTYFWGLPSYVEEFLQSTSFKNSEGLYVYFVATYGGTVGQADYFAKKILQNKGISLAASFGIKTVDNWTVSFDVNDKAEIEKTLAEESKQLESVICKVKGKEREFIRKDKKMLFVCKGARYFYDKARQTAHFNVDDNCIGCGACEKNCPVGAIKIKDGKPNWVSYSCTLCFGCLHNCPAFAINYGNKTQKNGQYNHP